MERQDPLCFRCGRRDPTVAATKTLRADGTTGMMPPHCADCAAHFRKHGIVLSGIEAAAHEAERELERWAGTALT